MGAFDSNLVELMMLLTSFPSSFLTLVAKEDCDPVLRSSALPNEADRSFAFLAVTSAGGDSVDANSMAASHASFSDDDGAAITYLMPEEAISLNA